MNTSLLRRVDTLDGSVRFAMMETIAEFALDQLRVRGEDAAMRDAHAAYYLDQAERVEPALVDQGEVTWMDRLVAEQANVRSALVWLDECGQHDLALRLAGALGSFWDIHGPISEGRAWLARVIARSAPEPTPERAKALAWAGLLARAQGDFVAAVALEEDGLAIARQLGDPRIIADALHSLGQVAVSQEDYGRAADAYAEALDLYRGLQDVRWAFALVNLGIVTAQQGDATRASTLLAEGLAQHQRQGNPWGTGFALRALGTLACAQHDNVMAAARFRTCVELWWEHGYRRGVGCAFVGLATVAGAMGQPEQAARLLGAVEAVREEYGLALWSTEQAMAAVAMADARAALGEAAYTRAWDAGHALPLEDAVAEALALAVDDAPSAASLPSPAAAFGLTPREIEVLRLLVEGHTDREIAETLGIAYRTATNHVTNILTKFNVETRTQAATYAVRHGLA
ncbi:MAG: LuxR C-terminal-related transcriptional regulator [Thermomicrobiales bacterium]